MNIRWCLWLMVGLWLSATLSGQQISSPVIVNYTPEQYKSTSLGCPSDERGVL